MEEKLLIDFLELDEVLAMLKEQCKIEYPDREFRSLWTLSIAGNELIIRAVASDGKPGLQKQVELRKPI